MSADYLDVVEKTEVLGDWCAHGKENFHTVEKPVPWQNSVAYPTKFKKQAVPNSRS